MKCRRCDDIGWVIPTTPLILLRFNCPSVGQRLARNTNFLAANSKICCPALANAFGSASILATRLIPIHRPVMEQDDWVFWISIVWFFSMCGFAAWVLSSTAVS